MQQYRATIRLETTNSLGWQSVIARDNQTDHILMETPIAHGQCVNLAARQQMDRLHRCGWVVAVDGISLT